jgi:putative endonuclease
MSTPRIRLGMAGEGLARRHLESLGYNILAANVRFASGEIDLVAEFGETIVFVEVRTRRGTGVGSPEESITARKRSTMTATAQEYLQAHESEERDWRIDVVAVEIGHDGRLRRIDIVENAVEG